MKMSLEAVSPTLGRGWKSMFTVCGLKTCRNNLFMRGVQSRVGISLGQVWYCSVDCFAAAACARIVKLSSGSTQDLPHVPRFSTGLAMLSKGYLTEAQLRSATTQSQATGEELGAALVRLGFASQKQLAAVRAAQGGYPALRNELLGRPVEALIPPTLLTACSAVPVHCSVPAQRLLLGFVYRVEHSLLNALEQITGLRAEPCFLTPAEFDDQMSRIAPVSDCEEVLVDDAGTPAQIASSAGGFALEVSAREASFVRCQDYIWARLSGKRKKMDLLFPLRQTGDAGRAASFLASPRKTGLLG
jgi:hypothetical protein